MAVDESDSWFKAGNEKMIQENYEEAIINYKRAIELNPSNISALNNKGIALFRLKRYQEAIDSYDKAIEINPGHANAWFNKAKAVRDLAQSYLDKANDDRTSAAKWINQALALFDSANQFYNKGESLSAGKT
jgi:tetratricopeptide (TPR) repeat protein